MEQFVVDPETKKCYVLEEACHLPFAIPVNQWTEKLWELEPSWKPELPLDVAREELI